MASTIKVQCADTSSQVVTVPNHFKLVDLNQLTNTLHGDGFFPFKGKITINSVARNAKDLNGEVLAGSGLQVKIRSYAAIIDGILLTSKESEEVNFTQLTSLSIALKGEVYVCAKPSFSYDSDGSKHKEHGAAIFYESASFPALDSGVIVVAKLEIPSQATQITSGMIDNSVKEYLIDVGLLSSDIKAKIEQVRREFYQSLLDTISQLRLEIANSNSQVLVALDAKIALVQAQLNVQNLDIQALYTALNALDSYVSNTIQPRITSISANLSQAVSELTLAIQNEKEYLLAKIDADELALSSLQAIVTAPSMGLQDRVMQLENQPQVPSDLLATIEDLKNRVTSLEASGGGGGGPLVISHVVTESDLDTSSTIGIDPSGKFVLPGFVPTAYLSDTFTQANGPVNVAKWPGVLGNPKVESNALKLVDATDGTSGRVISIPFPVEEKWTNDVTFKTVVDDGVDFYGVFSNLMLKTDGSGLYWYSVNVVVDLNSPTKTILNAYARVDFANGSTTGSIPLPLSAFSALDSVNGVTLRKVGLQKIGDQVQFVADDEVVLSVLDQSGVTLDTNCSLYLAGGWQLQKCVIDNVVVTSPMLGAYATSGILLTKKLESTSPILKASTSWTEILPSNTSVVAEVSLNGSLDWVEVTKGQLVDGTQAPWSSLGIDLRLRLTFATTDQTKTPVIGPLVANSSR